jgi:hypothetical protein
MANPDKKKAESGANFNYVFMSVSKEWSKMYFYIFIYMFHSTELMMSIDRELYELRIGNNTNIAALLIDF